MKRAHTTAARGVAIFLVLLCHVAAASLPQNLARIFTPLGGISVAVFLIISGYGNNESYLKKGGKGFWRRKNAIWIPYVVAFIAFALFNNVNLFSKNGLSTFLTIQKPNNYFWYIGYQFYWYFAFYISIRVPKKVKYIVLAVAAFCSMVCFDEIRAEQSLSFLIGVSLSDYVQLQKFLKKNAVVILLLIIGTICLALKQVPQVRGSGSGLMKFLQLMIKVPFGLGLIGLLWKVLPKVSCFRCLITAVNVLGEYSYYIYLSHAAFMILFSAIENYAAALVSFVVLTVFLSIVLQKLTVFFSNKMNPVK